MCPGSHRHLLRDVADLELKILHDRSGNLDNQALHNLRLEPWDPDFQTVNANRQGSDLIVAFAVGLRGPLLPSLPVAHDDFHTRNHRAVGINDSTLQRCGRLSVNVGPG